MAELNSLLASVPVDDLHATYVFVPLSAVAAVSVLAAGLLGPLRGFQPVVLPFHQWIQARVPAWAATRQGTASLAISAAMHCAVLALLRAIYTLRSGLRSVNA